MGGVHISCVPFVFSLLAAFSSVQRSVAVLQADMRDTPGRLARHPRDARLGRFDCANAGARLFFYLYALRAKPQDLGIEPRYSRPGVRDDDACIESLFCTLKYVPAYPSAGFNDLAQALLGHGEAARWIPSALSSIMIILIISVRCQP
jgi:transposase InsO family protein